MRRADRLFQLVQLLRRRRVTTARELAARLEVSERTIYRDVAALAVTGVPVTGEAGIGYRLLDFDLPPMMFTREEIEAVVLGIRIVQSWGDQQLARAAGATLTKVEGALPAERRSLVEATMLFAPQTHRREEVSVSLADLRLAIRESRRARLAYADERGARSERTVRPLGLSFFGPVWVFTAWCELRQDFRNFRPDRMTSLEVLPETFPQEPGRTFADYLRTLDCDA